MQSSCVTCPTSRSSGLQFREGTLVGWPVKVNGPVCSVVSLVQRQGQVDYNLEKAHWWGGLLK